MFRTISPLLSMLANDLAMVSLLEMQGNDTAGYRKTRRSHLLHRPGMLAASWSTRCSQTHSPRTCSTPVAARHTVSAQENDQIVETRKKEGQQSNLGFQLAAFITGNSHTLALHLIDCSEIQRMYPVVLTARLDRRGTQVRQTNAVTGGGKCNGWSVSRLTYVIMTVLTLTGHLDSCKRTARTKVASVVVL